MSDKIDQIHAHEILDSRGSPTVSVSVLTKNGHLGVASVPSGASTGSHEAHELRDGDNARYRGKGVKKACRNVNMKIAPKLRGMAVARQRDIDQLMIEMDGVYPGYGLAQHKGYGTEGHLSCLYRLGPSPIHRQSFHPISDIMQGHLSE